MELLCVWIGFSIGVVSVAKVPQTSTRLIENGRPASSIVIPDDASSTEWRAARELVRYLHRMTGAELPIRLERDVEAGARILLGQCRSSSNEVPDRFTSEPECYLIRSVPNGIVIRGSGDRGTLYGVYKFLEILGCRWLTHDEADDLVPQTTTISATGFNVEQRPAFRWRFFNGRTPALARWGVKRGLNGFFPPESARDNGAAFHWPADVQGVHTFSQLIPAATYLSAHPEWFPLRNGRRPGRVSEAAGQLCLAAPGLPDEFAKNVIRAFEADPSANPISISPNDGYGWCECEACLQLDRTLSSERDVDVGSGRMERFVGDRLFWFGNQVAERVHAVLPDRSLLMLAYLNYVDPPDTVQPVKNIVPFVCHYSPADYSRAIADPASVENRPFDSLLHRWVEVSPNLMFYSYVSKSMWWRLPRPVLSNFAADVKYLHGLGIRHYYCQSTLSEWDLDGPLYYVISRLLWNPDADPSEIAREWIDGMFGPAAASMTRFYEAMEQSVRKTGQSFSDNPPGQVPGLFDADALNVAMAALRDAESQPVSDVIRRRIDRIAKTFRDGYWMIKTLEDEKRGDPLVVRLLLLGLYVTGVLACVQAWRTRRRSPPIRRTRAPLFWLSVSVVLAMFWLNREFGFLRQIIELGRQIVQSQDWYQSRETRRFVLLTSAGLGGVVLAAILCRLASGQWKRTLLPFAGVMLIGGLSVAQTTSLDGPDRASSFHQFDARFHQQFAGCSVRWAVESIGASLILTGAAVARRADCRVDLSAAATSESPAERL